MSTLRELKTRIGSVASTQKTTSAMKMISSSKMRKATGQLQRLSPYRHMVQHVISHLLVTDQQFDSPLIAEREVQRVALVVFGSDDGLCGGFNVNIFKQLLVTIDEVRRQYGDQVGITVVPKYMGAYADIDTAFRAADAAGAGPTMLTPAPPTAPACLSPTPTPSSTPCCRCTSSRCSRMCSSRARPASRARA